MGTMPEMTHKPNMGTMPEMTHKPNMGPAPRAVMPEMLNKPNMADTPYTPKKPNMDMAPKAAAPMTVMPEMVHKHNMETAPYKAENIEAEKGGCGYKSGELPSCAPLSVGFVPFQQKNPPKYSTDDALTKGTLFPGLDLPWKNTVNKSNPYAGTPLGELMELHFAITELNLYLDTHPKDAEAFDMLKTLNKMLKDGTDKFVRLYGPQSIMDLTFGDEYTWTHNPWPWDFDADKGGGK
jgi:spore coat protein JB